MLPPCIMINDYSFLSIFAHAKMKLHNLWAAAELKSSVLCPHSQYLRVGTMEGSASEADWLLGWQRNRRPRARTPMLAKMQLLENDHTVNCARMWWRERNRGKRTTTQLTLIYKRGWFGSSQTYRYVVLRIHSHVWECKNIRALSERILYISHHHSHLVAFLPGNMEFWYGCLTNRTLNCTFHRASHTWIIFPVYIRYVGRTAYKPPRRDNVINFLAFEDNNASFARTASCNAVRDRGEVHFPIKNSNCKHVEIISIWCTSENNYIIG